MHICELNALDVLNGTFHLVLYSMQERRQLGLDTAGLHSLFEHNPCWANCGVSVKVSHSASTLLLKSMITSTYIKRNKERISFKILFNA